MTWQYKFFKWCGGEGIDMNLAEDIEFCRSRVLTQGDDELGPTSCSIVGFVKDVDAGVTAAAVCADKNFIEVTGSETYWSYYMRVYDVKYVINTSRGDDLHPSLSEVEVCKKEKGVVT